MNYYLIFWLFYSMECDSRFFACQGEGRFEHFIENYSKYQDLIRKRMEDYDRN